MEKETKHTPGPWEIEEIYPDGDFKCRIIARKALRGGELINTGGDDAIIVGEPSKRGGYANIHSRANAELIASAPTLKAENEQLKRIESQTKGMGDLVLRLQTELSEMKKEREELVEGVRKWAFHWDKFFSEPKVGQPPSIQELKDLLSRIKK